MEWRWEEHLFSECVLKAAVVCRPAAFILWEFWWMIRAEPPGSGLEKTPPPVPRRSKSLWLMEAHDCRHRVSAVCAVRLCCSYLCLFRMDVRSWSGFTSCGRVFDSLLHFILRSVCFASPFRSCGVSLVNFVTVNFKQRLREWCHQRVCLTVSVWTQNDCMWTRGWSRVGGASLICGEFFCINLCLKHCLWKNSKTRHQVSNTIYGRKSFQFLLRGTNAHPPVRQRSHTPINAKLSFNPIQTGEL